MDAGQHLPVARAAALLAAVFLSLTACEAAQEPDSVRMIVLSGGPYERGLQHGQAFSSEIRSLYTQLLATSIMPYLNREQRDVMAFLSRYQAPQYQNGQFAYRLLLESGENLIQYMPPDYVEELRGIADGARVPFEEVLILNTAFDTMLAFRSIVFYIKLFQGPHIVLVEFLAPIGADGIDNDGDGAVDEAHEAFLEPYEPRPHASLVEVPEDAQVQFLMTDFPEGVNPESIRIQTGGRIFTAQDDPDAIQTFPVGADTTALRIVFAPPDGFPPASVVSLLVQASDLAVRNDPGPVHARQMRDERICFTTRGYGRMPHEVPNVGEDDGRTEPPSIAFAARGSATPDGAPRLAHHFALLDAGAAHEHTLLILHKPTGGRPHVTLGWTGTVAGFSGMNADGVAYAINTSDSLDNPLVGQFQADLFDAQLISYGTPVAMMGREILRTSASTGDAVAYLAAQTATFGWNVLLADAAGTLAAVEMDSNITGEADGGKFVYTPDAADPANLDPWGRPWASEGADDLRMASHYQKNLTDIDRRYALIFHVRPQRFWSSFYNRSLRAHYLLGDEIRERYGRLDAEEMIDLLREPDLVDERDSMTAAVFEPVRRLIHYGLGRVPAVEADFRTFDLAGALGGEGR